MRASPLYSHAVIRVTDGEASSRDDVLAVEEPLEIQLGYERGGWRVHKTVSITMRTPGHDEELAAGFLCAEGILRGRGQVERIHLVEANVVRVELRAGETIDWQRLERHFYTTSSCGVCGKTSLASLRATGLGSRPVFEAGWEVSAGVIDSLHDRVRAAQPVFDQTGGLHAAALFSPDGELLSLREDVGRHNAVDKLLGAEWLAGRAPRSDAFLFVSGRASFELVQKAVVAGVPMLVAVGAPSSLAAALAEEWNATLVGFARGGRFNVYSAPERIAEAARVALAPA